jgi:pyruvate dehydrogenase E1 component alpha subunit
MTNATVESLIAFKNRIRGVFADGDLPFVVHLSGGNEKQLIEIFKEIKEGDWILGSHRAHYHWLLAGGGEAELEHEIREGHSMYLFNKRINFMTSSVLAGMSSIAAGLAWALKAEGSPNKVWCFLGDGAAEQGHFYEAIMFVEGRELPCTYVVEDNDCSVDTNKRDRRGKNAKAIYESMKCVRKYEYRTVEPHCGPGLSTMITFKKSVIEKHAQPHDY